MRFESRRDPKRGKKGKNCVLEVWKTIFSLLCLPKFNLG
jgi:hypothetical protein